MILLVSGASMIVRKHAHSHLGWLVTPRNCNPEAVIRAGVPWAADNDCYQRLDARAYRRMLRRLGDASDLSRLLFVTAPDVVGDARTTLARFRLWCPVLRYYGLPAAFVAQDGQTVDDMPWNEIAALFIGGSTQFKEVQAGPLIREARLRKVHVHAGRVNTLRRMRLMDAIGPVDSFDGSIFAKQPDKFVPWMLRGLHYRQHGIAGVLYE